MNITGQLQTLKIKYEDRLPEKLTDTFIVLMAVVFLCAFGPKGYVNIVETKYRLFCLFCGSYVLVQSCILTAQMLQKKIVPDFASLGKPRIFLLFYAGFTCISFALSQYKSESLLGMSRYEGLVTLLLYCACALLISLTAVPKMLHLYAFGAGITVCCTIALIQLCGANPFGLYPGSMNYYDKGTLYLGEYLGTVGNADLLSGILAIALPLFFYFAFKGERKQRLLLIPGVLSLLTFFGMKVYGCFAGVFVGIAVSAPFFFEGKRRKIIFFSEAILIALLLAAIVYVCQFGIQIFGISIAPGFSGADSGRLYIWENVLKLIKEKPLFGFGPDTLRAVMTASFQRFNSDSNTMLTAVIDVAHNEYLNVWVSQGLFAMLAFIAFILSLLLHRGRAFRSHTLLILKCAILCYAVQAFFEISMMINAPFFWILSGILIRMESEA